MGPAFFKQWTHHFSYETFTGHFWKRWCHMILQKCTRQKYDKMRLSRNVCNHFIYVKCRTITSTMLCSEWTYSCCESTNATEIQLVHYGNYCILGKIEPTRLSVAPLQWCRTLCSFHPKSINISFSTSLEHWSLQAHQHWSTNHYSITITRPRTLPKHAKPFKLFFHLWSHDIRPLRAFYNKPWACETRKKHAFRAPLRSPEPITPNVFYVEAVNKGRKMKEPPAMKTALKDDETHEQTWKWSVKTPSTQLPSPPSAKKDRRHSNRAPSHLWRVFIFSYTTRSPPTPSM